MGEGNVNINRFENWSDLQEKITQDVFDFIKSRQQKDISKKCSIALSGGKTPLPLYHYWSNQDWPWGKLEFSLVDERLVDSHHIASNYGNILREFSFKKANIQPLVMDNQIKNIDMAEVENRMMSLTPFDLVILGMGEDGHTASWLPGALRLNEAMDGESNNNWLLITGGNLDYTRVTMTWSLMRQTKKIILLITGEHKIELFNALISAREEERDALLNKYPVCRVLYQRTLPVEVYLSNKGLSVNPGSSIAGRLV